MKEHLTWYQIQSLKSDLSKAIDKLNDSIVAIEELTLKMAGAVGQMAYDMEGIKMGYYTIQSQLEEKNRTDEPKTISEAEASGRDEGIEIKKLKKEEEG